MRNQKGYVAWACNGQAVVTADQVIARAMLSQHPAGLHPAPPTAGHLPRAAYRGRHPPSGCAPRSPTPGTPARRTSPAPMPTACGSSCRWPRTPARTRAGTAATLPEGPGTWTSIPATARATRRLRHHRGKEDYKMRARTVEPVFGQLKTCQKLTTMSRRGLTACESEWLLACTAHNLRKLHRHRVEG